MGVRTLVGVYDGTTAAAVMVDSVSGFAFGPIFEGDDAQDDIDAFLEWLGREPYVAHAAEIGLEERDVPTPGRFPRQDDPRVWPDSGLEKLVVYWRRVRDAGVVTDRKET